MSTTSYYTNDQVTADDVIRLVEQDHRVVVELSIIGEKRKAVMRYHDGTYYCDTGIKLLMHSDAEEFRSCLKQHGLVSTSGSKDSPTPKTVS